MVAVVCFPLWLKADERGGCTLVLHIQPGAKRSEVLGEYGEALKIRIASPAVDGRANEALIAFLAQKLSVTKAKCCLISGACSRKKRITVHGLTAIVVLERLLT